VTLLAFTAERNLLLGAVLRRRCSWAPGGRCCEMGQVGAASSALGQFGAGSTRRRRFSAGTFQRSVSNGDVEIINEVH